MVTQFAAHLLNTDTNREYMIVGNTPEEAEALGARQVKAEGERGVTLEMMLGPLGGPSLYPTGQIVEIDTP